MLGYRASVTSFFFFFLSFALAGQVKESAYYEGDRTDSGGDNNLSAYHAGKPVIVPSADPTGRFFHFALSDHHFTTDPGLPQMPVKVFTVKVPEGMFINVRLSEVLVDHLSLSTLGMEGKLLYPSQIEGTKNEVPDETVKLIDYKSYASRTFLPHDTVTVKLIGRHRGEDYYEIAVYPLFYNPAGEAVNLITSMKLNVSQTYIKGTEGFSITESIVSGTEKLYINGYSENPVGIIVVADNQFKKVLTPFIKWKTISGYDVTVIYSGSGGAGTTYDEIKGAISSAYSSLLLQNKAPEYLLIVGDLSLIPSSGTTSNTSDLYYAEFDGNGDFLPELYTGRLPVADTNQLKIVIKKITDYEKFSYGTANTFWRRAVVTAGNDAGYSVFMNSQVNYLKTNYFNSSNGIEAVTWLYPSSSTKDDSLKLMINGGIGILNYTGHGDATGLSDPTLKVASIAQLSNGEMYPLIIANACRTAQISAASCFGREMLTAEGKGAIGYIGCTNDSYWSEDFYWAVGTGIPDLTATYSNTGLGAFDRFFHQHGEEPSEWFYTLGQMLYAGNMSVSASTTAKKKYYWETYMLLGDPTMVPYIGKPDTLTVSIPDTLPPALTSVSFLTVPYSYAAVSDFEALWDASFAGPSGNVTLELPVGVKDSCLIVITGQNLVPYQKTVYFGDNADEMLVYSGLTIDDSSGNNNGQCDYGERVGISMVISNPGSKAATNITSSLSVTDGTVTVERDTIRIAVLAAGASVAITDSLIVKVSDSSKDKDNAGLLLSLKDDKRKYRMGIDIMLHAPVPEIVSCIADDYVTGNGNGVPDAGENVTLTTRIRNNGSSVASGSVSFEEKGTLMTIDNPVISSGLINPGEEAIISTSAAISPDAVPGSAVPVLVELSYGNYVTTSAFALRIGMTRETWEADRFDIFPWVVSATNPWIITSSSSYENVRAARSAVISDSQESILAITLNNPEADTLSFYARVSSEEPFDVLLFRCDSIERMKVSGETGWFKKSIVLSPGMHFLEWVYKKDKSVSSGMDGAWVDLIDFPDYSFIPSDIKADTVFLPPVSKDHSTDPITGRVINMGRSRVEQLPLSFCVNSGKVFSQVFDVGLDPGDTVTVTFDQRCDFSVPDKYDILLFSSLPGDGYLKNDTVTTIFSKTDFDFPDSYKTTLMVMPNPCSDQAKYEYFTPVSGEIVIEVSDLSGRLVRRVTDNVVAGVNADMPLDLTGLAGGMYIIQIRQGSHFVKTRVIKASKK